MELLYADNLVVCGESLDEFMGKYKKMEESTGEKGSKSMVSSHF